MNLDLTTLYLLWMSTDDHTSNWSGGVWEINILRDLAVSSLIFLFLGLLPTISRDMNSMQLPFNKVKENGKDHWWNIEYEGTTE